MFVVGERIKHKIFGEGTVINIVDEKSGVASHVNYITVKFDNPIKTEYDCDESADIIDKRVFTPTSLEKFLVKEGK